MRAREAALVCADLFQGFGYGFYDGITGVVTQPIIGAKQEGAAGFFKGMGKGLGGLVLKPGAGSCSLCYHSTQANVRKLYGAFPDTP